MRWALAPLSEVDQGQQREDGKRRGDQRRGRAAACRDRRPRPPRPRPRPGRRSRRRRRRRSGRRRRRRPRAGRRRGRRPRAARARGVGARSRPAPAPVPADHQHRQQRLELVADPVEADAEPGVGPEQRERGQRRAGDHVDRVGEDGQRRGDGEGAVAAQEQERERRQQRREEEHEQPFGRLPRFERRAEEEDAAAGRRSSAPATRTAGRARRPRLSRATSSRAASQTTTLSPIDRPAPRGDHLHPRPQRFDRRRSRPRPRRGSAVPTSARGIGDPEVLEDRRRHVGREDVAVHPGAVGGEVAVEAAPGDADRDRLVATSPSGRAIAIRQLVRPGGEAAGRGRPGAISESCGDGVPLPSSASRGADPGTMSAGADSARSTTARRHAARRPSRVLRQAAS